MVTTTTHKATIMHPIKTSRLPHQLVITTTIATTNHHHCCHHCSNLEFNQAFNVWCHGSPHLPHLLQAHNTSDDNIIINNNMNYNILSPITTT
jgi:hypothetical protein